MVPKFDFLGTSPRMGCFDLVYASRYEGVNRDDVSDDRFAGNAAKGAFVDGVRLMGSVGIDRTCMLGCVPAIDSSNVKNHALPPS